MNENNYVKSITEVLNQNLPHILTGLGVAGVIATGVSAAKAAPKAKEKIDGMEDASKLEKVCAAAPFYIPTFLIAGASIGCIIGADRVSTGRYLALASSYAVMQKKLDESTKNDIKEVLGIKTNKETKDEDVKDKEMTNKILDDTSSTYHCYDVVLGKEFEASIAQIHEAASCVNAEIARYGNSNMATFYSCIDETIGCMAEKLSFGNDYSTAALDIDIKPELDSDGRPYITIDYDYSID